MSKYSFISTIIALASIAGLAVFAMNRAAPAPNQSPDGFGSGPSETSSPPEFATVEEVIDGDEIVLNTGHHIRYIGVRTPTVGQEVQCFGPEAIQANESIIGQNVRLEVEPLLEQASDGAWTRYVYLQPEAEEKSKSQNPKSKQSANNQTDKTETNSEPEEIFINERILEGGYGFPVVAEDMVYGERMLSAARFSAATGKGLWSRCETTQTASGHTITQPSDECTIKGVKNEAGNKVYRNRSCALYAQTIVLPKQNEGQYFCTEDEAEVNGYKKAIDCGNR